MKDLITLATEALAHTEANALIMGATEDDSMFWCLPLWECESEVIAQTTAAQMTIIWADRNGCGEVQVVWAYQDMK